MAPKERKSTGRGRIWPRHKVEAVLEGFKGQKSVAQICQQRGIAQSTFFAWREQFLKGAEAAVDALEMAVADRRGEYLGDLEVRSDGGPQFTAHRYARTIAGLGLRHTVTPARSPDHNPFAEAFIGAFKEECVYQSHWTSRAHAVAVVEAWIAKYRSRREQAALGGLAPLEYRAMVLRQFAA